MYWARSCCLRNGGCRESPARCWSFGEAPSCRWLGVDATDMPKALKIHESALFVAGGSPLHCTAKRSIIARFTASGRSESLGDYVYRQEFGLCDSLPVSEVFDENQHSSAIQRNSGNVQLRQHVRHPFDRQQAPPRRSLFGVPSVLHGQAEDRRHRRARRAIPATLRFQDDRPFGVTVRIRII